MESESKRHFAFGILIPITLHKSNGKTKRGYMALRDMPSGIQILVNKNKEKNLVIMEYPFCYNYPNKIKKTIKLHHFFSQ